jgi:hypothetical protein
VSASKNGKAERSNVCCFRESHKTTSWFITFLFVLDREVFEPIGSLPVEVSEPHQVSETERENSKNATAPRVFISYCHTSPEHEKWVESLGTFLRENGIDRVWTCGICGAGWICLSS